jgi:hypothetical protein
MKHVPMASLTTSQKALDRLQSEYIPEKDKKGHELLEAVRTIHQERIIRRVAESNPVMAATIANHLDKNFPGDTPFFATFLVGNGHFRCLDNLGLEGGKSDLCAELARRGYRTVTLDIEPMPRYKPQDKPGEYFIHPEMAKIGVDFSLHVVDPGSKHAERWR